MDLNLEQNIEFTKIPGTARVPTSLVFNRKHLMDSECISACHNTNGSIIITCTESLKLLDNANGRKEVDLIKFDTPTLVVEHRGLIYSMHEENEACTYNIEQSGTTHPVEFRVHYSAILVWSGDMTSGKTICKTSEDAQSLAVSDDHIAVGVADCCKLIVLDRVTDRSVTHSGVHIGGLHFLHDGHLLAAKRNDTQSDNRIVKYKLDGCAPTVVWTGDRMVDDEAAIWSDEAGLIFVFGVRTNDIQVISPHGMLNIIV